MKLTLKIENAIERASILHKEQMRKGGKIPYISHPFSVAWILSNYTDDEDIIIAGLLHDVLEDVSGYSEDNMREEFGDRITNIVKGVSGDENDGTLSWIDRKQIYLDRLKKSSEDSLMVSAADKIHNLSRTLNDIKKEGEEVWARLKTTKEDSVWFYSEVFSILRDRLENEIVDEFQLLLNKFKSLSQ